jgi:hypothetical protein
MSRAFAGSAAISPRNHAESGDEAVAHAPNGGDVLPEVAELLPKPPDVVVDRAVEALKLPAPDPLDKEFAVESPAGVGCKQVQQLEFLWCQGELGPVQSCTMRSRLDAERAVDDSLVGAVTGLATPCLELDAAQRGAGPREKLAPPGRARGRPPQSAR